MHKLFITILILLLSFSWCYAAPLDIIVRPTDIDVKGHVNNARYVEYLQWARWDWLDEHELSNEKLEEMGITFVVVNINLNYKKECKRADKLQIETNVEKIGDKSVVLRQEIKKADDSIALQGTITLVAIDIKTRKSCVLSNEVKRRLGSEIKVKEGR